MVEVKNAETILVEQVFQLTTEDLKDPHKFENLKTLIFRFGSQNGENMPYPQITEYIYVHEEYNIESLKELIDYVSNSEDCEEITQFFSKFIKQAELAITQKQHFENQIKNANEKLANIEKTVKSANKEFNDIRKNVYTDFISILGIFSALLFGLFVGFDAFKSIIEGITSNAKISRVVILGSLMLMGLLALTFVLLNGIAMLTNKTFKNCCEEKHCKHNLYQMYPVFTLSLLALIIVMLAASVVMIANYYGLLYEYPMMIGVGIGIVIIALFILSYCLGLIRFPDNKK
ncbi:hypothetical protein GUJ44_13075 [Enterococcus faecalis]|uniref:hypothetical protein n=1 Tax=Enterococcus faecalis TaxID=1351 RepID=UPI00136F7824|nr:hypothetical protein [Enterococcus faecalis]EGO5065397.1 hypothetical protein [Enterococcus faecalis]EGO5075798.1 hypothetical protein [Enterococcus faecalis]EHV2892412.1 hypothetical protein [Enterococcus faecalis]NAA43298.1 hypothetical protein [Enterococcus faecalis]NAA62121.1 hypothetical protein [Enterococcus faecalis]